MGAELFHPDERTDMTMVMVAFCSLAKAPKTEQACPQTQFLKLQFIRFVDFIAENKYLNSQINLDLDLRSSGMLCSVNW